MDNLIKSYYMEAGTYTDDITGNLIVNVPDVILKNMTVTGDLIIGDGVGDGNVILDGVTVTGRILVRGGGENSVKFIGDSSVQNIIVARVDGQVRIYSASGVEIGCVTVDGSDDVIIEGSVGTVTVLASDVTVTATDAEIVSANIEGENVRLTISSGATIDTVSANAADTTIEVSYGGRINDVVANGENTEVTGRGRVNTVLANADHVSITTPNTSVTAAPGTTGVMAGLKPVTGGSTRSVPTPSYGGGGDSKVLVRALSITGADSIECGKTLQLGVAVTPENATNKAVTWSVVSGPATIDANGLLKTTADGAVVVKAAAQDGSSVETTKDITVTLSASASEALAAVNAYLTLEKYNYAEAPSVLESHLATLGIDVGAESDYAKLQTAEYNRKTAVFFDLNGNKPEEGYDLATLKAYFSEMIATRLVTQASMDHVNGATSAEERGISWVTDLLAQFKAAAGVYDTHSDIALSDKISTLQDLVDRYEGLPREGQTAVLTQVIGDRPEGGYARSQDTTKALDAALTAQEKT